MSFLTLSIFSLQFAVHCSESNGMLLKVLSCLAENIERHDPFCFYHVFNFVIV